ncbi:MAG: hypothetical protein ABI593_05000 [Betaproteobacteria bacterium]
MPEPVSNVRSRTSRAWWLVVPAIALAVIYPTPFGGWLASSFHGSGVRWQDAYIALDTAEANLPRDPVQRERLLVTTAMVDSEPPMGPAIGPRLHPIGTLARLRYETLDESGARIDTWDVRALVPNIGNGMGPFWRSPCRRRCSDEIAANAGTRVRRSGEPGIAEEWVLRMPVGETFEMGPRPLRTQDILDARERSFPLGSVRVGERFVPRPARIRVTLVDACAASVRVGTLLSLEIDRYSHLPLPRGFETSRWAQIDGCGKLAPLSLPAPAEPGLYLAPPAPAGTAAVDRAPTPAK